MSELEDLGAEELRILADVQRMVAELQADRANWPGNLLALRRRLPTLAAQGPPEGVDGLCLMLDLIVVERLIDGAPAPVLAAYRATAREAGLGYAHGWSRDRGE